LKHNKLAFFVSATWVDPMYERCHCSFFIQSCLVTHCLTLGSARVENQTQASRQIWCQEHIVYL